jgi:hypothetical protein
MPAKFTYSAFYYKAILAALQRYRAANAPELSDFSPYAPETQLERMMALVAHLNNANMDILAGEMTLPTAQLLQSAINKGNDVGYPFKMYSPSVVSLVGKLTQDITVQTVLIPAKSLFWASVDGVTVPFENLNDVIIYDSTDYLISYYSKLQNGYLSSPSVLGCVVGDAIYIGSEVMCSTFALVFDTPLSNGETGVWEYYDGLYGMWTALTVNSDGTSGLTQNGELNIVVPQSASRDWSLVSVGGQSKFWIRYRLTSVAPATALPGVTALTTSVQYVKFTVTEGQSVSDTFISDGTSGQMYQLSTPGLVEGSLEALYTQEGSTAVTWDRLNFLSLAGGNESKFKYVPDKDGNVYIMFGDGLAGRIPPLGITITVPYRVLPSSINGNVPAKAISGTTMGYVSELTNYRGASGFKAAFDDLDFLRDAIPAWVRETLGAPSTAGISNILVTDALGNGTSPIVRANVIDEGVGSGIIQAVVVGTGGDPIDADTLTSVEDRFNNKNTGITVPNRRIACQNYIKFGFAIIATVYGGNREDIVDAITSVMNPLAQKTDPVTNQLVWQWDFGALVSLSFLIALMQDVPDVKRVILTEPHYDLYLSQNQLPYVDASGCYITVKAAT